MEPKEAVLVAKEHVRDLFGDEGISNLGLEEIALEGNVWKITIGFSRKWDVNVSSVLSGSGRAYKVLRISKINKQILSVMDRTLFKSFI